MLQVLASLAAAQLQPSRPCHRTHNSHNHTHAAGLLRISVHCLCIAVGMLTYHRQWQPTLRMVSTFRHTQKETNQRPNRDAIRDLPTSLTFVTPVLHGFAGLDESVRPHADFDGLSLDMAWRALLQAAEQYGGQQQGCRLQLAAVQAALGKERRLKLPSPLLAPFQVSQPLLRWVPPPRSLLLATFQVSQFMSRHSAFQCYVGMADHCPVGLNTWSADCKTAWPLPCLPPPS